jgi:N-acetylmuramoyl-L-alanine amidase
LRIKTKTRPFIKILSRQILKTSVLLLSGTLLLSMQAPESASPAPTPSQEPSSKVAAVPQLPAESQTRSGPGFFVMLDAGHGGDDRGAHLGGKLAEKDLTLALARRIRAELQERGVPARMTRDADVNLSLEQRAEATNAQRAAAYVCIHAGIPGGGVRVYTPAFGSTGTAASGQFLTWDNAQDHHLARSRTLARGVASELGRKKITVVTLGTPLRPLNNINAAAIAIELAADPDSVQDLADPKFQTTVATAVAVSIAQLRPQLEGQ